MKGERIMKPLTLSKLLSMGTLLVLLAGCSPKPAPTPMLPPQVPTSTRVLPTKTIFPPPLSSVPPTPSTVPPTPTSTPVPDHITVSYLEAADWLVDLAEEDRDDQILDWTVLGLAGLLQLDVETLRDAFYDQVPVRDPLFSDMAANRSGPGRGLPDGQGGLNVLVPVDDPYASRTIGMVLDDYRKDAGSDPKEVTLRRYTIDHENKVVTLESEPPSPTDQVRKAHGYREMAVDTLDGLKDFLDQPQHLSRLEIRNGQLWAGGWNWPGTPTGHITPEDLTVLQRGYLAVLQGAGDKSETLPDLSGCPSLGAFADALNLIEAFSLVETLEELKALIESDPALAQLFDPQEVSELSTDLDRTQTDEELQQVLSSFLDLLQERMDAMLAAVDSSDCNLAAALQTSSEPGFSLDPGQPLTVAELVSLLDPVDYPELTQHREIVDFIKKLDEAVTAEGFDNVLHSDFVTNELLTPEELLGFDYLLKQTSTDEEIAVVADLYRAMVLAHAEEVLNGEAGAGASDARPNPRKLGSVLVNILDDRTPYQIARYDGGLQGTEAGMTYFYTDLLGKAWRMEKGTGAPVGAVTGFVTDIQARTPWSHCKTEDESGRLWFGLREEAITATPNWVDLGSISTRVFTLIEDPSGNGVEIEPSYSFGRIIWWWDDHYLPMADYEPQYHRLDQLMRWSAAIGWLVDKNSVLLPEVPDGEVKGDWRFGDWLKVHPELRWHYDVPFVEPPAETTEALLTLYSEPVDDCGTTWVLSGGISNPSIQRIGEIQEARPRLSPSVARAGLSTAGTDYSLSARSGTISTLKGAVTVQRVLGAVMDKTATVDVSATGRKVWSLANVKAWVNESAPRQLSLTIAADGGQISQRLSAQGLEVGELTVTANASSATVRWQPGVLDRVRRALTSLQDLLPGRSLPQAVAETRGASLIYVNPDSGRVHMRVNDPASSRWIAIEKGLPEPSDKLAFRFGKPGAGLDTELEWYVATMSGAPELPASGGGMAWLVAAPDNTGATASVQPAEAPSLDCEKAHGPLRAPGS